LSHKSLWHKFGLETRQNKLKGFYFDNLHREGYRNKLKRSSRSYDLFLKVHISTI